MLNVHKGATIHPQRTPARRVSNGITWNTYTDTLKSQRGVDKDWHHISLVVCILTSYLVAFKTEMGHVTQSNNGTRMVSFPSLFLDFMHVFISGFVTMIKWRRLHRKSRNIPLPTWNDFFFLILKCYPNENLNFEKSLPFDC